MLKTLSISNYALIDELNIQPSLQLNTITGETGAGKSIMLGAMGLLLGKRAESKVLLDDTKKCIVEGEFDLSLYKLNSFFEQNELDFFDDTIVRREIAVSGKSRAFIDDTPVTLDVLKQLMINLIDIHSQHDTLLLGGVEMQLQIIDLYAQNQQKIENYSIVFDRFQTIKKELNTLKANQSEQTKELDFNKFLLKELDDANLTSDEEFQKLEEELKLAENSEEILSTLSQISQIGLESDVSIISTLDDVLALLNNVANYSTDLEDLKNRLSSTFIELKDVFSEIEYKEQEIDFDPLRIEEIRAKVDVVNSLMHKHKVFSVDELIAIQVELENKVNVVEKFDDTVSELELELTKIEKELRGKAEELSKSRKIIFEKLKINVEHILKELGMPNSTLKIVHQQKDFSKNGFDEIQILFSANKGVEPQSLKQVASGGEFSRLMFTIKYLLADKTAMPTIIFDEIDTGISGEIAIKMGKMMNKMAQNHQVITITHLPQVAALGSKHYFVYKAEIEERTFSNIKQLENEERELEIAKMISGDNPSQVAFENARELLSLSS